MVYRQNPQSPEGVMVQEDYTINGESASDYYDHGLAERQSYNRIQRG